MLDAMGVATRVRRQESEHGWWEAVAPPIAPRLRPHVLSYCGFEEATADAVTRRRELPIGAVVLIAGFGPELETSYPHVGAERTVRCHAFAAGLHDTWCVVESPGSQACIQVNLTPIGAHLLLGTAMHELSNRVVDLGDLLGPDGARLPERLHAAPGWPERFALLDALLVRRLDAAASASPDVAWAWRRLTETGGRLPVAELCGEIGCSRRHLLRRFREQVGLAPKAYARVLRFERAVARLGHGDEALWATVPGEPVAERGRWGRLALDCGYFDQAHMNRDFRALAGLSPGELVAGRLPGGEGLAA
jgi:AraC-like DNA-binding protein